MPKAFFLECVYYVFNYKLMFRHNILYPQGTRQDYTLCVWPWPLYTENGLSIPLKGKHKRGFKMSPLRPQVSQSISSVLFLFSYCIICKRFRIYTMKIPDTKILRIVLFILYLNFSSNGKDIEFRYDLNKRNIFVYKIIQDELPRQHMLLSC